ncbi:hypothetical protein [Cylindrospermopsis raciborskii]|uniref:hypothetical protein n=1 Tax=Cylindrospermopsis raciborskii TaxID=77022 RepID=UPI003879BCFA
MFAKKTYSKKHINEKSNPKINLDLKILDLNNKPTIFTDRISQKSMSKINIIIACQWANMEVMTRQVSKTKLGLYSSEAKTLLTTRKTNDTKDDDNPCLIPQRTIC